MMLYIPEVLQNEISDFQKGLMEKEIEVLNREFTLNEGSLDLKKVYIIETDDGAEAQIYIRNNTDLSLRLEGLPVHLTYNDSVIGIVCPNFKELSQIPPKSIAPFKVEFNHENLYYPEYINEADIKIGVDMKIEKTINHEIDNIPETLNYEQKAFIDDFCKNLNELRADTYDFNVVTLGKEVDRSLNVAILVRNGFENDIEVAGIPLVIYSSKGYPMYEGQFKAKGMIVKAKSASLFNLNVPANFIPISEEDYDKFTVKFGTHS